MERAFHARKEGSRSSESVYCFITPTDRLGIKARQREGAFMGNFSRILATLRFCSVSLLAGARFALGGLDGGMMGKWGELKRGLGVLS